MTAQSSSIKIRKVKHSQPQIATVRYLDRVCFLGDTPFPIYDDTQLWIGKDNGIPVCFCGLTPIDESTAFLSRAGVLKQYSGRGLHRRMINLRLQAAKKQGFEQVISYVHRLNVRSLNNLLHCGFRAYYPLDEWGHDEAVYLWRGL